MRIWSIHPKYLDPKGLVALWRETLLAKNVLEGKTRGYKNHPQLNRFKAAASPLHCINQYLAGVHNEATKRGYRFNREKIDWDFTPCVLEVTTGQIEFEKQHLLNKLAKRSPEDFHILQKISKWETHPLFIQVEGEIEKWEIL